jgi:hypothetical protein
MRTIADASDLAELISDCAELPDAVVHPVATAAPVRQGCAEVRIGAECLATVAGMDDYGS